MIGSGNTFENNKGESEVIYLDENTIEVKIVEQDKKESNLSDKEDPEFEDLEFNDFSERNDREMAEDLKNTIFDGDLSNA